MSRRMASKPEGEVEGKTVNPIPRTASGHTGQGDTPFVTDQPSADGNPVGTPAVGGTSTAAQCGSHISFDHQWSIGPLGPLPLISGLPGYSGQSRVSPVKPLPLSWRSFILIHNSSRSRQIDSHRSYHEAGTEARQHHTLALPILE